MTSPQSPDAFGLPEAGHRVFIDDADPDFGPRRTPPAVAHLAEVLATIRRHDCDPSDLHEAIERQLIASASWKIGGYSDPFVDRGRLTLDATLVRWSIDGARCNRDDAVLILGEGAVLEAELQRAEQVWEDGDD